MGVVIDGFYVGNKRTRLIHGPSGSEVLTDAPRDNAGEGAFFSPTDLVAGALGACVMTIMGIVAERSGIDLTGTTMRVEKEMRSAPRRIARLSVALHLPARLGEAERQKMEAAAHACPVHESLHPDVSVGLEFVYDV
jgi:putative redox protein